MEALWEDYRKKMLQKRRPAQDAWEKVKELLKSLESLLEGWPGEVEHGGEQTRQAKAWLFIHEEFLDDGHEVLEAVALLSTPGLAKELWNVAASGERLMRLEGWQWVSQAGQAKARREYEELRVMLEQAVDSALALPGPIKVAGKESPTHQLSFVEGGLSSHS